jgi:c-di-AMP phosphodiesterase-like protein
MERMGGGGHLSSGATQIEDKSIAEVKQLLLETIDYIDDNE